MSINEGAQIGMGPFNDDASGYDLSAPDTGSRGLVGRVLDL